MSASSSRPEIYTIYCILAGEKNPFPVEIESNETVGALKDKIKGELGSEFNSIAAWKFELYQIDMFHDANTTRSMKEMSEGLPDALWATEKLSKVYEATPPEETIHILVQVPSNGKLIERTILFFH